MAFYYHKSSLLSIGGNIKKGFDLELEWNEKTNYMDLSCKIGNVFGEDDSDNDGDHDLNEDLENWDDIEIF